MSRAQFNTHYRTAISRFGLYLQCETRLNAALQSALDQLQESLIFRLPLERDREEAARFEQVWKFTCLLQPLLAEVMTTDRRWYNRQHQQTTCFINAAFYRDYTGPARPSLIKLNLLHFLHPVSSDWLMQDDLRCIDTLYRGIDGSDGALSKQHQTSEATQNNSTVPVTKPTTPLVIENSHNTLANSDTDKSQQIGPTPKDTPLPAQVSADLHRRFIAWLTPESTLVKDAATYIESPQTIERFIDDRKLEVSVGEVQQSLLSHGFVRELVNLGKKKRASCLRVPEDANV
ncbi:hypothetical protein AB833_29055 [Chromatiales bacterium (ex Bugula neritina AB1)]|nr:hypothetical protein AB833_29055 [Chromatiales bacterium (ex Bugula neritina AB1)]